MPTGEPRLRIIEQAASKGALHANEFTMRTLWLIIALGLVVTGCATTPAGEDPKGKELRAQASTVLTALVAYRKDHGDYPMSLQELAPTYLPNVPFEPGLVLDRNSDTVRFSYPAPWPQAGDVRCVAKLGDSEWKCGS